MQIEDLKNEIVVKTKTGDFKLLKNGKLEDLPSDDLVVPEDDIQKYDPGVAKTASAGAQFYFDVEDENELVNSQAANRNNDVLIRDFIQEIVDKILKQAQFEEASQQLKSIISSRLREVRNLAETREALSRAGVGDVDGLISIIEKYRKEVEEAIRKNDFKIDVKEEVVVKKPMAKPVAPLVVKKEQPRRKIKGAEYKTDEGVKMKFQHETTGPVEEIRNLSLEDFRKLGNSSKEAVGKVMSKINLLEDESLTKRAEGVQAWKQSEVYQLYLSIGAESMMSKKTVEEIILQRKAANKPFLAPDEFEEVADLNKRLSY